MPFPRRSRFTRDPSLPSIRISARDYEIVSLVERHRFLTSEHLFSLLGGSRQSLLRRLHLLFHHGFLERPRSQIEYFGKGGSSPIAYGLANKGAKLLADETVSGKKRARWNERNQSVGRHFLKHALAVSDVMVALELGLRRVPGATLLHEDLLALAGKRKRTWRVKVPGQTTLGIIPDRTFAIGFENKDGVRERAYYFLEADRGTMPVVRKDLRRTSMYRKLLAYQATWAQEVHRSVLGFHRFRVLIVTTGQARQQALVEACAELTNGRGLFLFCDTNAVAEGDFVSMPLQTGNPGQTSRILP